MNFTERRKQVFDKMDQDSALLLFSGIELHVSADEYLPFEANRNFFYLTGLRRDHMILMMKKTAKEEKSILFIEEADPNQERWFGRKVTVSEAQEITGIDDVRFLDSFEGMVNRLMAREDIGTLYFDCYRYQVEDLPDYNMVKAEEFAKKFPGRPIKNIAPVIAALRMQKDEDEIALVRQAIKITDDAIEAAVKLSIRYLPAQQYDQETRGRLIRFAAWFAASGNLRLQAAAHITQQAGCSAFGVSEVQLMLCHSLKTALIPGGLDRTPHSGLGSQRSP